MMTYKKVIVALAAVAVVVAFAIPAGAVQLKFNGDMNHRFILGTNHNDFINGANDNDGVLDDDDVYDNMAEIKYRFWFEAASDDGMYKGVFATEIGGLRFGETGFMPYSGDQVRLEARWGYFDFQLPFMEQKSRVRIGLQGMNVNYWLWKETVGAVKLYGDSGLGSYEFAWMRGYEDQATSEQDQDLNNDQDAIYGRMNFSNNFGIFALYQWNNIDDADPTGVLGVAGLDYTIDPRDWELSQLPKNVDMSVISLGTDGKMDFDAFFLKWDLIYQTGSIDQAITQDLNGVLNPIDDYDVDAFFIHADLGMKMGKATLTYTFWYASGDDDPNDGDLEAFLCTDVDIFDNIVLMEGGWSDDDYFTERPYVLDRGFVMNKLALDYQATEKTKLGIAGMYMMTAEDVEYTPALTGTPSSEDEIGFEIDAYVKYQLFKNVELAVNAGYLLADDAMDYFEAPVIQDGSSDEDIWRADMRIRYKF
jgi:hypothetical protein